jgi:hypothetical protein
MTSPYRYFQYEAHFVVLRATIMPWTVVVSAPRLRVAIWQPPHFGFQRIGIVFSGRAAGRAGGAASRPITGDGCNGASPASNR